jgi:hypothetical protein
MFSPTAAVGLSYSGVAADYATNDTATAADSNAFLRGFFRRYPHLARNDFYISGGRPQLHKVEGAAQPHKGDISVAVRISCSAA